MLRTATLVNKRIAAAANHNNYKELAKKVTYVTGASGASVSLATAVTQRNVISRYYASQSATSANTAAGKRSFIQRYEDLLQSDPVKTKMVTGSFLWGLGDLVAQVVPQMFASSSLDLKKDDEEGVEYDFMRTGRAVFFGFALHAPLSHVHYNFLESLTIRLGITGGFQVPIFKAVMEQFVYWSWVSNALYHGAMGAMQGKTPKEVYQKLEDVLWETQKAQWVFWIPVQLLNFRFVPVRHQLNVVLCTSVVWTALLSAWYPPENKNDDDKVSDIKKIKE